MIRLVTFDAANTLIQHSWEPSSMAINAARAEGLVIDETIARPLYFDIYGSMRAEHEELERQRDYSAIQAFWQRCIAVWLEKQNLDAIHSRSIVEYCQREVYSSEKRIWQVFPDVLPTINALRDIRIKIGIISNWDHSLHGVLNILNLSDKFDFAIASLELGIEKPAKGIFDEALRISGETPETSLHIGDSYEDDVIGAQNAGFGWLHLDRDSPTDFELKRVQTLCDVLEILK